MDLIEEYLTEAARCRTSAAAQRNPEIKAQLLDLAKSYDVLARQRQRLLELQEEIRASGEHRGG